MSHNLEISQTGIKLIKAFEGYRPVDRELISGQRIVGYGHRLYSEDAVMMNKIEASEVLRDDLKPFEDMINTEVHAPITQSQFDALCSFAFNIGPKAFLQSDTLRAINNGRPLDAANSLDIWRKSEIDGKIYVVDALMRRRAAEKALFLRTERAVTAGREDIRPVKDMTVVGLPTDDGLPLFTEDDANGIVATAPYAASVTPMRRREDGPAGTLQLSERDIIEDETYVPPQLEAMKLETTKPDADLAVVEDLEDIALDRQDEEALEAEPRKSPIAAAATDIVARLDALIEDVDAEFDNDADDTTAVSFTESDDLEITDENLEEASDIDELETGQTLASKIMNERVTQMEDIPPADDFIANDEDDLIDDQIVEIDEHQPVAVIDELAQDDALRQRTDSAAKYIETTRPVTVEDEPIRQGTHGLWIPILLGFILVGLAGGTMISGSERLLGEWGPILAVTGFVIGLGLIGSGVYAALRMNVSR